MNFEVILYAIIAIVLLARLWSVLGKRNDDEQQRPNPFVMPAPGPQEDKKAVLAGDPQGTGDPPPLYRSIRAAPASLAGALEQIKALDSSFDEKVFLQGARAAFTMIVEDFAKGDMSRITRLLGPKVLPHFQNALEERRKSGETMESHVTRIRDTETAAA
jgi:predicted lipid-binding transport protein (Tim44 family)